ncbi:flagellar brake protein [Gammaproteobacteria bacterium]
MSDYQEVTGDGPVLRILDRIRQHHALIHVRIKEKSNPWSSAIISVDTANRTWQFDELPSAEDHRLLLKERRCSIETRLDGVAIKFQAEVSSSGSDEKGLVYYQAPPPRFVHVYQRRSNFRAPIVPSQQATVTFSIPSVAMMRGRIRDVSMGGIGVSFTSWTQVLESGLQIPRSTITFPDGKTIYCGLKVCFVRRGSFGMTMGARFTEISRDAQKQVNSFVAFLDREQAKRGRLR